MTPFLTTISICSPAWGLSRAIVSDGFRDIGLPLLGRESLSVFIDVLTCDFCYAKMRLIFLLKSFFYVSTDCSRFYACLMFFIARCGLLLLSALVIFAFFEVRYDTLRRRDEGAMSVNSRPTVSLRA